MILQTMPENKLEVKIKLSDEKIEKINEICESFDNDPGELINVLHETQVTYGYLPAEVQEVIAHNLNISVAHVYGVVTFYSFFTMVPKGEHPISICLGTACYVRGAEKILDEFKKELNIKVGETTADKKRYKDAFIRVWDQNKPALSLYRKMGYADIAEIQQTKRKADSEDTFVMNKIYLHKKLI